MKIVAIVRTYNETKHIEKFCMSYQNIADVILVADGGSEDNTVSLASLMPKTKVRKYEERVMLENGYTRNPDWKHINFLIEWAEEEQADWVIFDDCDVRPNYKLKEDARKMIEEAEHPILRAPYIFMWGTELHFPALSLLSSPTIYEPALWGWKLSVGLRAIGDPPHYIFTEPKDRTKQVFFDRIPTTTFYAPYARLHFAWENDENTDAHVEYYQKSGLIPGMRHPRDFGGAPALLLDWMKE